MRHGRAVRIVAIFLQVLLAAVVIASIVVVASLSPDAGWFEAIGTWVGAIGTISAILIGASALRHDQASMRKQQEIAWASDSDENVRRRALRLIDAWADRFKDEIGITVVVRDVAAEPMRWISVICPALPWKEGQSSNVGTLAPGTFRYFTLSGPSVRKIEEIEVRVTYDGLDLSISLTHTEPDAWRLTRPSGLAVSD